MTTISPTPTSRRRSEVSQPEQAVEAAAILYEARRRFQDSPRPRAEDIFYEAMNRAAHRLAHTLATMPIYEEADRPRAWKFVAVYLYFEKCYLAALDYRKQRG